MSTSPSHAVQPVDDAVVDIEQDNFSFDAFISYSGFRKIGAASGATQVDVKIAERLHKLLESYRVPRALLKKSPGRTRLPRRLKKIFHDRDEVRVSSNLNDSLTEALRRSRFLIVICSPRARQSTWVNQEIAIFRGLGRGEQILPLLIEGEPAEAFPPELLKPPTGTGTSAQTGSTPEELLAQPLAADIRAPSVSESLRLLKYEKLRLLAVMLGCEYDDLRQREQERFVRRVLSAGAAMLFLMLVLTTLSILLFLAQQRASRNAQLALNAGAEVLPLVGLEPNSPLGAKDPVIREVHINNAITYLETLRKDDPENLKCLTTLRALYGTLAGLLLDRNRKTEAEGAFQKASSMVVPITLSRLRAFRPTKTRSVKKLSGEALSFPNSYDLNRLRTLLAIMEQLNYPANIKQAVDYSEVAAEYLLLLDTSNGEGKAEAQRVLQLSLNKFQQAQSFEPLTPQQAELVEALNISLNRLL
ncbi:MAG: toll/interleukin-1 receptor domain-containing protein [Acidobacteria bacterium]|nr:toll/interleukin-1 receptor domain-containing protein [Acidobacteriota bacterium]